MDKARAVLKGHFGYDAFRPGQEALVRAVLSGSDALGVMPTGAGKSICYQVPAVTLPGIAIVISPLVSLMGDQVRALLDAGVRGAYLNSSLNPGQQATVLDRAQNGAYDIMYVAPERLADPRFLNFAKQTTFSLVAVDEAHCVSQWGQDFRSAYLGIREFIEELSVRPPVIALTATATDKVRADIVCLLGLRDPRLVVTGFDRPNLHFSVEHLEPRRKLARIIQSVKEHPADAGIVYCSTRKDVEKVHAALVAEGLQAVRYHAGLPTAERQAAQRAFTNDDVQVLVATNAFGMGIDKSNVRFVTHYNMPSSMEAYYQEAGRAGRDGEPARCELLWSDGDIATCRFFIEQESENERLTPEEAEVVRASRRRMLEAMIGYCHTVKCLRGYILRYFGEAPAGENEADDSRCENCSNCEGGFTAVDVTEEAKSVLRCVHELRGRFGKGVVTDVLRGSSTDRVADFRLQAAQTFGTLAKVPASRIKEIIELLAAERLIEITDGSFPLVGLGPRWKHAGDAGFSLQIKQVEKAGRAKREAVGAPKRFSGHVFGGGRRAGNDDRLFEELRALRKGIADSLGKPPYVVFSDATLREMCQVRPHTDEEFLGVPGVGLKKLSSYGDQFMAAITKFERDSE